MRSTALSTILSLLSLTNGALVWNAHVATLADEVINYPGGWILPEKNRCVDICTTASPNPTCFVNTTDCIHKRQEPGDYDTLILEQLFLPQYCRDLLDGIDSTVAHRPVAPYPKGIRCLAPIPSTLSIHGLWPNYDGGYPACCNVSSAIRNRPFDPIAFRANHTALASTLARRWADPTQPRATFDALCELWNHEFQKHGLCYNSAGTDFTAAAVGYFSAAMAVADSVAAATTRINAWATAEAQVSGPNITQHYPRTVQLDCSNGRLARIRTCWSKDKVQIDCPTPGPCNSASQIRFDAYIPPSEVFGDGASL